MQAITVAASATDSWSTVLAIGLETSAVLVLGYRIYRLAKGGPVADVWGGAVLGALLTGLTILVVADVGWARWPALGYGLFFAVIVMPVWTLGVLLPLRPGPLDYSFTATYWLTLVLISISALSL